MESMIKQEMILYADSRRIDFRTEVHWNEKQQLLKTAFPVQIRATEATYDIQFGNVKRPTHWNTSWDYARFETVGHQWADLSERGYGVSLMNDCKYGYDIKDGTIRLSLLRAPKWPDVSADLGEHEFTYSLYPHEQDWRGAQVVRKAAELNHPAIVVSIPAAGDSALTGQGALPHEQSMIPLESRSVMLDTMKAAELGDGTIFRFYESSGSRESVSIRLPKSPSRVCIVNLLEEEIEHLGVDDGILRLEFKPFEIKSIKISFT